MGYDVVHKGVAEVRTSVLARSGPMIERWCRGLRRSFYQSVVAWPILAATSVQTPE